MTHLQPIEPPLDALRNRSFPDAARALSGKSAELVELWQQAVRSLLPTAEELTRNQLRDHIPRIIDQIIEALQSTRSETVERLAEAGIPHGEVRFHQDFNVNELLIEYQLLRELLLKEVTSELQRPLSTEELIAINLGIDTAQRRSVTTFVDHLAGQLRAADDLQSNYMSYLNHDLRGGMNGILLMVEVLKRELANEPRLSDATQDLESVRRAVFDSVSTMDRFVYAHRLGRGKQQAKFGRFDVNDLIGEVAKNLQAAALERNVKVTLNVADDGSLESDRELVRLILHSVLGNAIKHAPLNGCSVEVTALRRTDAGCTITIADSGSGMSPADVERLFIPQAPSVDKGRQSIKLGLVVSKMAAELIGAELIVQSELGAGTTIRIEIPERGIKPGTTLVITA